jgi:hypothetical protein
VGLFALSQVCPTKVKKQKKVFSSSSESLKIQFTQKKNHYQVGGKS